MSQVVDRRVKGICATGALKRTNSILKAADNNDSPRKRGASVSVNKVVLVLEGERNTDRMGEKRTSMRDLNDDSYHNGQNGGLIRPGSWLAPAEDNDDMDGNYEYEDVPTRCCLLQ